MNFKVFNIYYIHLFSFAFMVFVILIFFRLEFLQKFCRRIFKKSSKLFPKNVSNCNFRTNINNLGNECIDPNISSENRQSAVKWIINQLYKHTERYLPGFYFKNYKGGRRMCHFWFQ